jgi:hypothetical protein
MKITRHYIGISQLPQSETTSKTNKPSFNRVTISPRICNAPTPPTKSITNTHLPTTPLPALAKARETELEKESTDSEALKHTCSCPKPKPRPKEKTTIDILSIHETRPHITTNLKPVTTEQTLIPRETGDWMLNKNIAFEIFQEFGTPKIDLFASSKDKQAEKTFKHHQTWTRMPWR